MYVMLLAGSVVSALVFGALLENFSPGRLIQVIQGSAVVTIVLNGIALWKQESLKRMSDADLAAPQPEFSASWQNFMVGGSALRRLVAVGLGTMAFGMQDVLLEPYGGEILGLAVADTTKLTAALATGGLIGFILASHVLSRGADAFAMAALGALAGIIAFALVILSPTLGSTSVFVAGVMLIGAGGGLFGHGTLTATMNYAPKGQTGLALGAWGAVQATAAGVGIAVGGLIRDLAVSFSSADVFGVARGYNFVYAIEIVLLIATVVAMAPLIGKTTPTEQKDETAPGGERRVTC
jgi:BCD family chlorophyll transporter-like MFS transporter